MRRRFILGLLCCLASAAFAAPDTPTASPHKAYLSLIIDDLGKTCPGIAGYWRFPAQSPPRSCPTRPTPPNSPARLTAPARSSCCTCPWTRRPGRSPGIPSYRLKSWENASTPRSPPCPIPAGSTTTWAAA
ncbi:exported protein of unknown function [Pseudomonas mediterranea]